MTPGHQRAWRDLVSHRVAEAGAGLSAVQVSSAIDAAAPNARALSVLARALEPGDRVAGTLVLVYGQQLSRIVALTRDQVEVSSGGTALHLGTTPIDVPPPLGDRAESQGIPIA